MDRDQAVALLRKSDPDLARDSYFDEDVVSAARRFESSGEFKEVTNVLGSRLFGAKVMDLGAGNGIAAFAFAEAGVSRVVAVEPNPSEVVGQKAIQKLLPSAPVHILSAFGENLPLRESCVDIVYARAVLHHSHSLNDLVAECSRVLARGGVFLACREHIVDNESQLSEFLNSHALHQWTKDENAFSLDAYTKAIELAGLRLVKIFRHWDSVINAFPAARTSKELMEFPSKVLSNRFGLAGKMASKLPGSRFLVLKRLNRPIPGRLYTFVALKPE